MPQIGKGSGKTTYQSAKRTKTAISTGPRRGIRLSSNELLEASQALKGIIRGERIDISACSPNVRRVVKRALAKENESMMQKSLERINRVIVIRNAKAHHPTEAVKSIYKKMFEEE